MLLLEFLESKRARFRNKFFFGIKKVTLLNHLLFPALLDVYALSLWLYFAVNLAAISPARTRPNQVNVYVLHFAATD